MTKICKSNNFDKFSSSKSTWWCGDRDYDDNVDGIKKEGENIENSDDDISHLSTFFRRGKKGKEKVHDDDDVRE